MDWKERVTAVSGKVFPGLDHKLDCAYGNEVMSNLPLQMSLYFNVILSPFWMGVLLLHLNIQYHCFSEIYKFIITAILSTVFIVEITRFYLGYKGNLEDKIPELAGFWMLSILIQLPLQAFLLFNPHFRLHIVELTVQTLMFLMLVIELISSYVALKYTAAQQATYYRIMKMRCDVRIADIEQRYELRKYNQTQQ